MTVIRPNSISGVTSITALTQSIEFYKSDGSLSGANIDGISINTAGIITASTFYGNGSNLTGITGTTINNNADNRVITGSGTANTLEGEANLTYDGTTLQVQSSGSGLRELLRLKNSNASAGVSGLYFNSTTSGSAFDAACVRNGVNGSGQGRLFLQTNNGSGLVNGLEIEYDGQVTLPTNSLNIIDSIVHIGDTNTKIRFPSNDTISFETSGSERLRIDSAGRIGLGIANPDAYFSSYNRVVMGRTNDTGGMTIVSGSTSGGYIAFANGTSGNAAYRGVIAYYHSVDALAFATDGGNERLRINSTGNMSLGGLDPVPTSTAYNTASFHIHQTTNATNVGAQIHLTTANKGSAAGDGSQVSQYNGSLYINNQDDGDTYFYNNGSPTATIKANGAFGIATQAPTDKLHVNGTTNLVGNSYIGGDLYMYGGSYTKGIFIGGSGSANKLDDYEEGNYNISITGSGGGSIGVQGSLNNLRYTKIGRLVHVTGRIYINSSNNPSGTAKMNLPFASSANTNDQNGQGYSYVTRYNIYTPNNDWALIFEVEPNQTYGFFLWDKPSAAWNGVNAATELNQTNGYMGFDFTYTTAT